MLMYISEPYKIQNENRYKIQIDIDIRYKNYYSKCKSTIRHEKYFVFGSGMGPSNTNGLV